MKAVLRSIRITYKKANLIAGMVRGKQGEEALQILKMIPKKGAAILYKVLKSALSNAQHNYKQQLQDLYITRILVTQGSTYKRSIPISRGRVHPIRKGTAHIMVEVGLKEASKIQQKEDISSKLNQSEKMEERKVKELKTSTKPKTSKTSSSVKPSNTVKKKTASKS